MSDIQEPEDTILHQDAVEEVIEDVLSEHSSMVVPSTIGETAFFDKTGAWGGGNRNTYNRLQRYVEPDGVGGNMIATVDDFDGWLSEPNDPANGLCKLRSGLYFVRLQAHLTAAPAAGSDCRLMLGAGLPWFGDYGPNLGASQTLSNQGTVLILATTDVNINVWGGTPDVVETHITPIVFYP